MLNVFYIQLKFHSLFAVHRTVLNFSRACTMCPAGPFSHFDLWSLIHGLSVGWFNCIRQAFLWFFVQPNTMESQQSQCLTQTYSTYVKPSQFSIYPFHSIYAVTLYRNGTNQTKTKLIQHIPKVKTHRFSLSPQCLGIL